MATLGRNTGVGEGVNINVSFPFNASTVSLCSFPLQVNGATFTKMTVIKTGGASVVSLIGLIYNEAGVTPTSLLAATNPTSILNYGADTDLTFAAPFTLNSGNYHLGVIAEGNFITSGTSETSSVLNTISNLSNTFPAVTPSLSSISYSAFSKQIYATFTLPSIFSGTISN